ncbi:FAD-dependent oxidoreductase [Pararhodonellum marinum]|uniref:FAD-dependent oxidoreductase n=1 Tax=Pararhodonellum marinum TaxID=2755358 RepID=UPI00189031DB|nr:FAD-dependent oxidoreductase [Pararhodonellum marinum]
MKQPFIILIDDDVQVLRSIQRDISSQFREDYRISSFESGREALDFMKALKLKNEALALIISDQRMPEMDGVTLLEKARIIYPETKNMLLTAYSDIEVAIKAINDIKLDYYLPKPWSPPEEKLYPIMEDLLDDWHAAHKPDHEGIRIVGFQWSPKSHALKEFLSGNLIPYLWLDVENNGEAGKFLESAKAEADRLPLVVLRDGSVLLDPEIPALASQLGLKQKATDKMYDVVIIGAGPAGLAASVYGATEGLKTLLIEKSNPGGQASSSSRIENYLGFPSGLSGAELTRRAVTQTVRFGTELLTPQEVKEIKVKDGYKVITLSDGAEIFSRSIIISTGVAYRKLEVPGADQFTGAGVYYGSAAVEAHACRNEIIYIIGGGNSACQAAMYMCKFAKEVNMLLRKEALSEVAANYLVLQIRAVPNIKILGNTEIIAMEGSEVLETVTLWNNKTDEQKKVPAKAVFVYIGARPSTDWLKDFVFKDEKGFILTGSDLEKVDGFHTHWKLGRKPYLPESSVPGVFVSGDVRSGALTGISSAVGEGAMAIRFVRKYLQEM